MKYILIFKTKLNYRLYNNNNNISDDNIIEISSLYIIHLQTYFII